MTEAYGRLCLDCNLWKTADKFSKQVQGKNGLKAYCKECSGKRSKRYYAKNPLRYALSRLKYYEKRVEKLMVEQGKKIKLR